MTRPPAHQNDNNVVLIIEGDKHLVPTLELANKEARIGRMQRQGILRDAGEGCRAGHCK